MTPMAINGTSTLAPRATNIHAQHYDVPPDVVTDVSYRLRAYARATEMLMLPGLRHSAAQDPLVRHDSGGESPNYADPFEFNHELRAMGSVRVRAVRGTLPEQEWDY